MKLATLLTFPILICASLCNAQPPFYYKSLVKVVDTQSIYYGCTGTVYGWTEDKLMVNEMCGDWSQDVFKAEQVQLLRNRIGKGRGL